MVFLDKYGWPVETVKGRWFLNALRLLIHTRKAVKHWDPPVFDVDESTQTSAATEEEVK